MQYKFNIGDKVLRTDKLDVSAHPVPYTITERYIVNNKAYYTIVKGTKIDTAKEDNLTKVAGTINLEVSSAMEVNRSRIWALADQYTPKCADDVIVTLKINNVDYPFYRTAIGKYCKGVWIVDGEVCKNVYAWISLPMPYTGETYCDDDDFEF